MSFKSALFHLLGKEEEAVVVTFLSGPPAPALQMLEEVRRLIPDRRHFAVALAGEAPARAGVPIIEVNAEAPAGEVRWAFRRYRVGMAPVLYTGDRRWRPLRLAAARLAPTKLLAYNSRLERHHLRLSTAVASGLFLRGVPLDRIWLRPRWSGRWWGERSEVPSKPAAVLEGRPATAGRRRIAIVSPYFPWPLAHGGAVRIYHLIKEAAKTSDVFLFAFHEPGQLQDTGPVMELCARATLFTMPRYREPRWATLDPPEVHEFRVPALEAAVARCRAEEGIDVVQVEYTYMGGYGGEVLVEHDVTFDLYTQAHARRRTLSTWWDAYRWGRFERGAVGRFARVVTMSGKDARLLGIGHATVIPNGVDLTRFRPVAERPGKRLLFVGSFRHLPNIVAFRYFTEQVWPLVIAGDGEVTLTVVAGPEPMLYWRGANQAGEPGVADGRIRMLSFVSDVGPLYEEANLVIVPTLESAGTNLKVLEAMAAGRAVVSTPTGCDGLGLEHGRSVWMASRPEEFAEAVLELLGDPRRRAAMAAEARSQAEREYGWEAIGELQRRMWEDLAHR
jgi:polysaccharide biosynthesis protein PslH